MVYNGTLFTPEDENGFRKDSERSVPIPRSHCGWLGVGSSAMRIDKEVLDRAIIA